MNVANARSELTAAIEELSQLVPEMRYGQLLAAIGELCTDLHGRGLWNVEDHEFLESVAVFRKGFEMRALTVSAPPDLPGT